MKLLALATLVLCACTATRDVRSGETDPSIASLDFMKKLEGSWVALDEHGQPTQQVSSVFRVTSGGSAVEETVFPGTEKEMVTLYYVRDGVLQLTHYCMLGNQPHMLAQPVKTPGELAFVCDGKGVASEDEGHMHTGSFHLGPDGRLHSHWQMLEKGKETHLADFTLVRRAP